MLYSGGAITLVSSIGGYDPIEVCHCSALKLGMGSSGIFRGGAMVRLPPPALTVNF